MRRDVRRKIEARANRRAVLVPLAIVALLLICVYVFYQIGTPFKQTDSRGCPKNTDPVEVTVLLLDTSDPLTPKHKEELGRIANQLSAGESSRIGISPEELLVVYKLTQDPGAPEKLVEICRPQKNPKDLVWRDSIHRGLRFYERDWESFKEELTHVSPERDGEPQATSPLLETITVLAARHLPGRLGNNEFDADLIIFSDLLQHTSRFSHYESFPDAGEMRHMAPDLLTDLSGVRVSLFRLERPKYAKWQNKRHFYWWTELIEEQKGKIVWQTSL